LCWRCYVRPLPSHLVGEGGAYPRRERGIISVSTLPKPLPSRERAKMNRGAYLFSAWCLRAKRVTSPSKSAKGGKTPASGEYCSPQRRIVSKQEYFLFLSPSAPPCLSGYLSSPSLYSFSSLYRLYSLSSLFSDFSFQRYCGVIKIGLTSNCEGRYAPAIIIMRGHRHDESSAPPTGSLPGGIISRSRIRRIEPSSIYVETVNENTKNTGE